MKILLPVLFLIAGAGTALASDGGAAHGGGMTGRMMLLAIQLGIILFATRLGRMLFARMKLPGVLGELISGVVIGPFALGGLSLPGFAHGLFPLVEAASPIAPELYAFGAVAAIILLFDAGLETDLKLLLRYSAAGSLVGFGGIVAAFASGAWITSVLSPGILGIQVPVTHPVCLFMGVVSTATSVGITARVLSEKRKLDSPEGVTIISAAIVDDVVGIILLAIVLGIVTATRGGGPVDWGHVARIGIRALGIWLAASAVGILASRRISFLLKSFRDPTAIAIMALGLALILAAIFERAGLAMIIGAYIMGVSLSRTDIRHLVREHLHPVHACLVPVFFCITGMLIDVRTLLSPPVLVFGGMFTLVGFAAKLIGCGLPSLLARFNMLGALRIGVGMVPRGEVGLIVAGIGAGVALMPGGGPLPPPLFAAVVLMVMLSTLLAPPLVAWLLDLPRRGTRQPVGADADGEPIVFALASEPMAEFFMQKLRETFEEDGFFWHCLDRDSQIYQLRRNAQVIDLSRRGAEIAFLAPAADSGLVRGMILEASAAFEDALRALQKPFDSKALSHGIVDGAAEVAAQPFHLGPMLTERHIRLDLCGRTKADIFEELLGMLRDLGDISDIEAAREAIWERERKMSTALESGIAIPHGKTDSVNRLVCVVGIARDGVLCDALDGTPSHIFVMTLSPKSRPAPHVQFMATITKLLNATGRMFLLDARTAADIHAYLTGRLATPSRRVRGPAAPLDLANWLAPADMVPALRGGDPESVIREMLAHLGSAGRIADIEPLAEAVLARERQMSTVMGEGIALPHARTAQVERLLCVVGRKSSRFDFNRDGIPETELVFLVLTPDGADQPYLPFVAALVGRLQGKTRERLLAATTAVAMWEVLCRGTP